jgi:hypothetical protein
VPTQERHFVTFEADGIGSLRILKGEGAPKSSSYDAGWNVVSRPHRVGLTQWAGADPIRMSLQVIFEGWTDGEGQEIRISKLRRMAMPQGTDEPPIISVSGHGIPNLGPKRWVIESLEEGDNVLWDDEPGSGSIVRLRQDFTVNLLQYVAEDRTAFASIEAAKPGGGAWPKHYTWKKGDTLQKVAAKFYHNSKLWKKIANANNIRDPKNIKPGKVLIIPKP